jgi:hypothetical protein
LTKLDVDAKPSLANLTITLPKGIAISDGVTPGSQFVAANAHALLISKQIVTSMSSAGIAVGMAGKIRVQKSLIR